MVTSTPALRGPAGHLSQRPSESARFIVSGQFRRVRIRPVFHSLRELHSGALQQPGSSAEQPAQVAKGSLSCLASDSSWRPYNNDKTAVRGGFGVYNTTLLGSIFFALTDTLQAASLTYNKLQQLPYRVLLTRGRRQALGSGSNTPVYGTARLQHLQPDQLERPLLHAVESLRRSRIFGKHWCAHYLYRHEDGPTRLGTEPQRYVLLDHHARPVAASHRSPVPQLGYSERPQILAPRQPMKRCNWKPTIASSMASPSNPTYTWAKNLADNQGPQATGFRRGKRRQCRTGLYLCLYNRPA